MKLFIFFELKICKLICNYQCQAGEGGGGGVGRGLDRLL